MFFKKKSPDINLKIPKNKQKFVSKLFYDTLKHENGTPENEAAQKALWGYVAECFPEYFPTTKTCTIYFDALSTNYMRLIIKGE